LLLLLRLLLLRRRRQLWLRLRLLPPLLLPWRAVLTRITSRCSGSTACIAVSRWRWPPAVCLSTPRSAIISSSINYIIVSSTVAARGASNARELARSDTLLSPTIQTYWTPFMTQSPPHCH
jgi:hypothetical protein